MVHLNLPIILSKFQNNYILKKQIFKDNKPTKKKNSNDLLLKNIKKKKILILISKYFPGTFRTF